MSQLKWIRFLIPCFFLMSCASYSPHPSLNLMSSSEYESTISENTQSNKIYDGFMNILDISCTLLNTNVIKAQADQSARIYQWTPEQYQAEKSKNLLQADKQTDLFLSFFVPERKHDDLQRANSKWKLFLDVNGKRYEPKVTRIKGLLAETQSFYPHHTRWHSAYRLSFPVPTAMVEKYGAKLTLTGPVAASSLSWSP